MESLPRMAVQWLCTLACALWAPASYSGSLYSRVYDLTIRQSAEDYLPQWPWRVVKAEWIAESNLNPNARSPAGAEGIAQFMEPTWAQVAREMGLGLADRRLAAPSIEAGAYYLARLRRGWAATARPEADRRRWTQASYNAGPGSLIAAQRACGGAVDYPTGSACLPRVTGAHARETLEYVPRIERIWADLEAGQ